jgi:3-methylcrotonyl-CoA carboxylase alpha subunit
VKAGDIVIVMESMKMELRIVSEIDGLVAAVRCKAGETVDRNSIIAVVEPA